MLLLNKLALFFAASDKKTADNNEPCSDNESQLFISELDPHSNPAPLSSFPNDSELIEKFPEILQGGQAEREIYLRCRTFAPVLHDEWFSLVPYAITEKAFKWACKEGGKIPHCGINYTNLRSKFSQEEFNDLGLDNLRSFSSAFHKIEANREKQFSHSFTYSDKKTKQKGNVYVVVDLKNNDIFGLAGVKAFEEIIPLTLKAQIIEDFFAHHKIDFSDSAKAELFRELEDPWLIHENRIVKRIIALKEVIQSVRPDYDDYQITRDIEKFYKAGNPIERLMLFYHDQEELRAAKDLISGETGTEEKNVADELSTEEQDTLTNKLAEVIKEKALSSKIGNRLIKLIQLGACSYDDVVEKLDQYEDPAELLKDAYILWKRNSSDALLKEDRGTQIEKDPEYRGTEKQAEYDFTVLEMPGHYSFNRWLNNLDPTISNRIRCKLGGFFHGEYGDSKTLKGGVSELRVSKYRIYYGFTAPGKAVIISGGFKQNKDEQTEDIRNAVSVFAEYKKINGKPVMIIHELLCAGLEIY